MCIDFYSRECFDKLENEFHYLITKIIILVFTPYSLCFLSRRHNFGGTVLKFWISCQLPPPIRLKISIVASKIKISSI